jgi:hypothetical protein
VNLRATGTGVGRFIRNSINIDTGRVLSTRTGGGTPQKAFPAASFTTPGRK